MKLRLSENGKYVNVAVLVHYTRVGANEVKITSGYPCISTLSAVNKGCMETMNSGVLLKYTAEITLRDLEDRRHEKILRHSVIDDYFVPRKRIINEIIKSTIYNYCTQIVIKTWPELTKPWL